MPQLSPRSIILLRSMGEVIPDDGYLPSSSSEEVYDDEEVNITQRDLSNGNVVRTFRANGETMLRLLESEMQSSDNCSKQNVKDLLYGIADTAVDIAEKAESLAGGGGQPDGLGRLEEILAANVGDMNEEKLEQLILENLKEDQPKAGEPQAENTKEKPKKQCGKCANGGGRRRSKRSRKKSNKKKGRK
tara:strand:+ start:3766 stop:4332 length:567 start_codon:yes stop_codon:yes gene_type:complete